MLENFQGNSWGSIPPLRMPSLLPRDICHGRSSSRWLPAVIEFQLSYSRSWKMMLWKVLHSICNMHYALNMQYASSRQWDIFWVARLGTTPNYIILVRMAICFIKCELGSEENTDSISGHILFETLHSRVRDWIVVLKQANTWPKELEITRWEEKGKNLSG